MADFIDLFTGSTTLDAHPSDSGHTWGRLNSGQATNLLQVLGGQAYDNATVAGGKEYVSSYVNASADCSIRAIINVGTISGSPEIGLWGRCVNPNSTSDKGYMGRYEYGVGYKFYTINNASYNIVGTATSASPPANGDSLELRITGNTPVVLALYKNGTLVATMNDASNFLTAAGSPGIHIYNPGGVEANNYRIDTVWSGSAGGPTLSVSLGSTSLNVGGATTTATASGFTGQTTTPATGPVFTSSNTSVATVNASTGVVTPVAGGTCTITATGGLFNVETAVSATITVSSASVATTTTLSLGSSSGYRGVPVNVTYGTDGTFAGTKTVTASDGGAGGTWGSLPAIAQNPATVLTSYTPPPGVSILNITLTVTVNGLTPASQAYTANADTITASPSVLPVSSTTTVTITSAAGLFASAPTLTSSLAGSSVSAGTRISNNVVTYNVTTGPTAGSGTFTESIAGATAAFSTASLVAYLSQISGTGFTAGLTTVGYTIYPGNSNTPYASRSQSGVLERPGPAYTAPILLPSGQQFVIVWDNGSGSYGDESVTIPSATASGGSVTVAGYASGQDPATLLLTNPANKLATDNTGAVLVQMGQTIPTSPTAGTHGYALFYTASKIGRIGTAQGGSSTTITLDSGASAADNAYKDHFIKITGNTGAGQWATVTGYVGSTKVATIWRPSAGNGWSTAPDNTSIFMIEPEPAVSLEPTQAFNNTGQTSTMPVNAANLATTFWTDTTAGDFAVSGSPGKILATQLGGSFTDLNSSVLKAAALANAPVGGGGGGSVTVSGYANGQDPASLILAALPAFRSQAGVTAPSIADCLLAAWVLAYGKQVLNANGSPPTFAEYGPDGVTAAKVFNLDSGTAPTTRS